jgi:hypothetical protein
MARWTFEKNTKEVTGGPYGRLVGGADVIKGRLRLRRAGSCMKAGPWAATLGDRTLAVWVRLDRLTQPGRFLVRLEDDEGEEWDGLLFGSESGEPRKWCLGSSSDQRSRQLAGPDEDSGPDKPVHLAIVVRHRRRPHGLPQHHALP